MRSTFAVERRYFTVLRRAVLAAILAAVLGVASAATLVAPAAAADLALDDLAGAEPREYPVHAVGVVPTDPQYPSQWGPAKVGMPDVWARATGAPSIVIAVVDTGVDAGHPDLAGRVLAGRSYVDDGLSGDPNGHGTYVARVAAAAGNDGAGMAGYCWQCRILPVRVLDAEGGGNTGDVAAGVVYAADQGADIINLSLSGNSTSISLEAAIAYARGLGAIVIAAAGNQTAAGQDLTVRQYPAASTGVIGVVATSAQDAVYSWSYRGSWTSIAAPGCVFLSGTCGTSYASPAIAGILGLALAAVPSLPGDALLAAMYATSAPVSGGIVPNGRVDAAAFFDTVAPVVVTPVRVAGGSRVLTAIEVAKRAYPNGAPAVIVARSDAYADALAAAPLASKLGAPVLLTRPSELESAVADQIKALGATSAWLVGGPAAITPAVEDGLRAIGVADVRRLAGDSKYETAAKIAAEAVAGSNPATVYLAVADRYADAVAVSGLAAMTRSPILLVDRDTVPAATAAALAALAPTTRTIVGGPAVVSDAVAALLGAGRIFGNTRYETSTAVANAMVAAGATAGKVWVATGLDWPDALAAGPASAATGGVLLLTDGSGSPITNWLASVDPVEVLVVGGAGSVSDSVFAALTAALG